MIYDFEVKLVKINNNYEVVGAFRSTTGNDLVDYYKRNYIRR